MKSNKTIKFIISAIAIIVLAGRLFLPNLQFDISIITLIILMFLPWFSTIIDTAELPGGIKVKFKDIEMAGEQIIVRDEVHKNENEISKPTYSFLLLANTDPNLAIVGLRIEIEKRLRLLALKHGVNGSLPLSEIIKNLTSSHVLDIKMSKGLTTLVNAGNQAAHGAKVENKVYQWAFENSPKILAKLDFKLAGDGLKDVDKWLEKVMTIIEFKGQKYKEVCLSLLSLAKQDEFIRVDLGYFSAKSEAANDLIKLGAFELTENEKSLRFPTHFVLTALGNALLSHLISEGI